MSIEASPQHTALASGAIGGVVTSFHADSSPSAAIAKKTMDAAKGEYDDDTKLSEIDFDA